MSQLINNLGFFYNLGSGLLGKKNMPNTLSYLLTCGRVIRDDNTKLFTYLDVFDHLIIPRESEFIIQSFYIAGKLYTDVSGSIRLDTRFIYPNGQSSLVSTINGPTNPGYLEFAAYFGTMKLDQVGTYYLKVNFQGEELENKNQFYFEVRK